MFFNTDFSRAVDVLDLEDRPEPEQQDLGQGRHQLRKKSINLFEFP